MKDALQITGVAEVVLSVRNLPLMREFYRDVLGFALHSEGCYDQGPKPTPGGEATSSFLTVRQIDTPLGRNGHPQLLALDRLQTSRLCQETPVWPRADHLHPQSPGLRDSPGELRSAATETRIPGVGAEPIRIPPPGGQGALLPGSRGKSTGADLHDWSGGVEGGPSE